METERSMCYRRDLGHLSDSQWLYACEEARKGEWFPSIQTLLDLAAKAPVDDQAAQRRLMARIEPTEQTSIVTKPTWYYEQLVQEYPRHTGEGWMDYIVRIAELAGTPPGGPHGQWPVGEAEEVKR